jgi:hypothetical protein
LVQEEDVNDGGFWLEGGMVRESGFAGRILAPFVCLLLAFTFSCGQPREQYAGKYEARGDESQKQVTVFLELKEDGEAVQMVNDDEVTLRWKVKGDEIRFHTKSGGIIIGKIMDGTINVKLPGGRLMAFKKTE